MKNNQSEQLSAAQYEIMEKIWRQGEATVNQVLEAVNKGRKKKLRRTTIQVQMTRLVKKGWLSHRTEGRTYLYSAVFERDHAQAFIANDVTNRVFGGSCADLIKCLFNNKKVSALEIKRIKKILKDAKGGE